jgi:hypothetical protein
MGGQPCETVLDGLGTDPRLRGMRHPNLQPFAADEGWGVASCCPRIQGRMGSSGYLTGLCGQKGIKNPNGLRFFLGRQT